MARPKRQTSEASAYNADSIKHLEGMTHIRARPGMYIPNTASEGLHHLLWEATDNAVDEFLAGHNRELHVTLDPAKTLATVRDAGRGIPVEKHPKFKVPTLEAIFTNLHTGGKFDRDAYAISGGLHGVGMKATCALSETMTATTVRGGKTYAVDYARGKVVKKLYSVKKTFPSGTEITFHPDHEIFGKKLTFDPDTVADRLKGIAFLCPGLKVTLTVGKKVTDFTSKDGLSGLLRKNLGRKEKPAFDEPISFSTTFEVETQAGVKTHAIDASLWWTSGDGEGWFTYVNMINVPDGGTQVTGAKRAIVTVLKKHAEEEGLSGEDFRDGLRCVFHFKLSNPHFEGQAKNRLNNPECASHAQEHFTAAIKKWAKSHSSEVSKLIERASAMAEARRAYKARRRIGTESAYADKAGRGALPDKLVVAPRAKPADRELFVVEGDSAGGSAKQSRDSWHDKKIVDHQEILPLRGKVPNAARFGITPGELEKLFENNEISSLVRSIGAGHDVMERGESCDPSRARVGKVILLMDADPDGGHIASLLLTFMIRFLHPLIDKGMVWVAVPPLFMARWPRGRAFADSQEEARANALKAGAGEKSIQIQRFKGLGEMNPEQLCETALAPATRRLIQVSSEEGDLAQIIELMGKDVTARKELLGV